jgi:hypothetical protein
VQSLPLPPRGAARRAAPRPPRPRANNSGLGGRRRSAIP